MRLPPYIVRSPKRGTFSFRLSVPEKLRATIGKREIRQSLKTNDQRLASVMALKLYHDAMKVFDQARKMQPGNEKVGNKSELELYNESVAFIATLGYGLNMAHPETSDEAHDEYTHRDYLAEKILGKHFQETETGDESYPSLTKEESYKVAALYGTLKKPSPTIKDAIELYLTDKNADGRRVAHRSLQFGQMVRRNGAYLAASLNSDKKLTDITREDARKFRAFLISKKLKISTINKIIKSISTIVKYAITELDLNSKNHFIGLTIPNDDAKRELRYPFNETQLSLYLTEAKGHMNTEAYYCTVLQAYTGARTEEITGLEIDDVKLDMEIPHIIIQSNSTRPNLKTGLTSKRYVPLIGDAIGVAKDAMKYAKRHSSGALFPRYAKCRGSDSLSAIQMKTIRKYVTTDPKITAYSTRHRMKDLLRNAGIDEKIQLELLGHSSSKAADSYGAGYWLPVLREAMEKAFLYANVRIDEEKTIST